MRNILLIIGFIGFGLAGCSSDTDSSAPAATAKAPAASAPASMPAASEMGGGVIDHSRDEKEFALRRSLSGVGRMIDQYKKDGHDAAALEAQKAELEASLSALLGG